MDDAACSLPDPVSVEGAGHPGCADQVWRPHHAVGQNNCDAGTGSGQHSVHAGARTDSQWSGRRKFHHRSPPILTTPPSRGTPRLVITSPRRCIATPEVTAAPSAALPTEAGSANHAATASANESPVT